MIDRREIARTPQRELLELGIEVRRAHTYTRLAADAQPVPMG
jgi:hypothetical protein